MRQLTNVESTQIGAGLGLELVAGAAIMGAGIWAYSAIKNYFTGGINPDQCITMYEGEVHTVILASPTTLYDIHGNVFHDITEMTQTIYHPITVC